MYLYARARNSAKKKRGKKQRKQTMNVGTHGPCGRLGSARLLEGHLERVWSWVVGVGGDGRGRRQALEGGVGLGVGRGRGNGRRGGIF